MINEEAIDQWCNDGEAVVYQAVEIRIVCHVFVTMTLINRSQEINACESVASQNHFVLLQTNFLQTID